MYTAELERHKKEKEEWKRKAQRLEDQASALQVHWLISEPFRLSSTEQRGDKISPLADQP